MLVKNAIKKLATFGTVQNAGSAYWASNGKTVISFRPCTPGEGEADSHITCIRGRREGDTDDTQRDYFAGSFYDNLTQAIRNA